MMKTILHTVAVAMLLLPGLPAARSQDVYQTGAASVSIEPDTSMFSAALAGYGVPRAGRFSLTWRAVDSFPAARSLVSMAGKWYLVDTSGNLLERRYDHENTNENVDENVNKNGNVGENVNKNGNVGENADKNVNGNVGENTDKNVNVNVDKDVNKHGEWTPVLKGAALVHITALNDQLYGINESGEMGLIQLEKGKLKRLKGNTPSGVTALTTFRNQLYAATADDELWKARLNGKTLAWTQTGKAAGIISLSSDKEHLYALNQNDSLWAITTKRDTMEWRQLARKNQLTYAAHINHIVVRNGQLYGLDDHSTLYLAEHKTTGTLAATALAIQRGGKTVVLLGADVCGFDNSFVKRVKAEIFERCGLSADAVLINASHTHFAPVTQSWRAWQDYYHHPDTNYLYNVVQAGMVKAVENALASMTPGKLFFARGETTIGRNRRPAANAAKPYDGTLDVIRIEDMHNRIKSVLFITGCHPVFENKGEESFTLSANFPAVARSYVEEHGPAGTALFIQGCAGDINPVSHDYTETGTQLGKDVVQLLDDDSQPLSGPISFFLDSMQIPVKPWSVEKIRAFKAKQAAKPGDIEAEKDVRWANIMLERYKQNAVASSLPEWIHTLRIGNWKLVGLSREAVTEYGPAIRALWPDDIVSVAGYTNDVSSYLPNGWHINSKIYEGYGSFFWYAQPGIPPPDVLSLVVEQIKRNDR